MNWNIRTAFLSRVRFTPALQGLHRHTYKKAQTLFFPWDSNSKLLPQLLWKCGRIKCRKLQRELPIARAAVCFFSACVCASFACFNFVTMCMCAWLHPHTCTVFVVDWQQVSSASFAQAKFEFNSLVFCSLANTTSKFWQDLYRQHLLCFLSSQLVLSPLLLFNFPSPPSFLSLSHRCFFSYISRSFCPTSFLLYFSFASLLSSTTFFDLHLPLRRTHSHTPSVCQQHLTTPISPQRASLLYHRAHNSRIPAACVCVDTHTLAAASGSYQSLVLIGQWAL